MLATYMESLHRFGRLALFALAVGPASAAWVSPGLAAEPDLNLGSAKTIESFLRTYCFDCHGHGGDEGGLDLEQLDSDFGDEATFVRWQRIHDRVEAGEMPPESGQQPAAEQRAAFVQSLASQLSQAHSERKGTVLRRLNRREYQNTLNDLFGTQLDLAAMLPEDGLADEFSNVGESLNISMVHLQQYLAAIDLVMDRAIATTVTPPEPLVKKTNYAETREGKTHIGKAWKQLDDGAVVFFSGGGYPSGMLRTANAEKSGRYKIRVTGYAYQSNSPITFSIGATTFERGAEQPTFAYRCFKPDVASTVEIEAWLDERYMVEITPWGISDAGEVRRNGVDTYEGPGLAILGVELSGPLVDEFPSRGHRLLFDDLDRREVEPSNPSVKKKPWYEPQFEIRSEQPREDASRVIERVATAAFRRPLQAGETDRYLALFESQLDSGAEFEAALRTSIAAIFCSPDFLFLHEQPGWLDDWELAARLAYFLTRTAPDAELLAAAASGQLAKDPQVLLTHTRRLLDDPRRQRFVIDFTDAWLNLRDIEFTSPDKNLYPEFDSFLQFSMLEETRQFFSLLIDEDLGVRTLVDSDFAMLNNRLAVHYEINGVESPQIRKVALPGDSVRGGLLSQGSILKVSANGTNTSPVVRGVWVLERMLGIHPPPPPPGISGVEPDIRGAATMRELLDKHRDLDSCRACHQLIDPPGFALECFDPIGGWRERFRSLGEGERVDVEIDGRKVRYRLGPRVDASGELPDGTTFDDYLEFREHLASQPDLLARTLATKLLTFGTGRPMGFSDRTVIDQIVEASSSDGHGVRKLIELVVLSKIFRCK